MLGPSEIGSCLGFALLGLTTLRHWLKKLTPPSPPTRSKSKTNSFVHVFFIHILYTYLLKVLLGFLDCLRLVLICQSSKLGSQCKTDRLPFTESRIPD